MWLELARRITITVLIVAVATGFTVPAAHAELHHGQVIATAAMSTDNVGTCAHEGCGSNQQVDMQGACFAPCAGVTALSTTDAIIHFTIGRAVLTPSLARGMADRTIPPDPHPPKQYELI